MALFSHETLASLLVSEIQSTNTSTQTSFLHAIDRSLTNVCLNAIADTLSNEATKLFHAKATFSSSADSGEYAHCRLLFPLDSFFHSKLLPPTPTSSTTAVSSAPAYYTPNALYIYDTAADETKRAVFHSERISLEPAEEAALLQILQQPGTQFSSFQQALHHTFPSIHISLQIHRTTITSSSSTLYYGESIPPATPQWHLTVGLMYPLLTPAIYRVMRETALSISTT